MAEELSDYWELLRLSLRRPALVNALLKALKQHRQIEHDFRDRLRAVLCDDSRLQFPHLALRSEQYLQRNFFSILFLSIFETLGISRKRGHLYGLILHALRGVVTAADNIVDQEAKGAVRLDLEHGHALPNILLILLQDGLIHQVLGELAEVPSLRGKAWKALVASLFAIAAEESQEEGAIETVLAPEELLKTVHHFRGGRLLQLAFEIPRVLESGIAESVATAMDGVGRIGLALQVLDDVTDLAEDINNRNHNLLRSWIVWRGLDGPVCDLDLKEMETAALMAPEKAFPKATLEVMSAAIGLALQGFGLLRKVDYPVDQGSAMELIQMLFKLRGLKRLWNFWLEADGHAARSRFVSLNMNGQSVGLTDASRSLQRSPCIAPANASRFSL